MCVRACRGPLLKLVEDVYKVPGLLACLGDALRQAPADADVPAIGWFVRTLASHVRRRCACVRLHLHHSSFQRCVDFSPHCMRLAGICLVRLLPPWRTIKCRAASFHCSC